MNEMKEFRNLSPDFLRKQRTIQLLRENPSISVFYVLKKYKNSEKIMGNLIVSVKHKLKDNLAQKYFSEIVNIFSMQQFFWKYCLSWNCNNFYLGSKNKIFWQNLVKQIGNGSHLYWLSDTICPIGFLVILYFLNSNKNH